MTISRLDIAESLRAKSYRHKLVSEHFQRTTAAQLRAMRQARHWTQRELGKRAGVGQTWISQVESPDYERMSVRTLKKLGEAFDVALILRYVPFSQFADWIAKLDMQDLAPPGFDDDVALFEPVFEATEPPMLLPEATIEEFQWELPMDVERLPEQSPAGNVRYLPEARRKVEIYAS